MTTAALPNPTLRVVGRMSLAFILDLVRIGRMGHDMIDGLLLLTIVQANVAPLLRDAALQRAFATYDDLPPDDIRRPVSISAVAHSLRLPFETVRRRVVQLARDGHCEITSKGVIVPGKVLASPEHRSVVEASYALVRQLYWRLSDVGGLPPLPPPSAPLERGNGGAAPLRMVVRLSSDYFLRGIEALRRHIGGLAEGIVLLDIVTANTEHLSDREGGAEDWVPDDFIPDSARRPVRVAALSVRLGLPEETVRRYVAKLLKEGRIVRVQGGLILPADRLALPHLMGLMRDNLVSLHRLFNSLALLGVLAEWDLQRPQLKGAAA